MLSCLDFSIASERHRLSQARPAARTRFLSETIPLEIAPIVAVESIFSASVVSFGHAFRTTAAAESSAMKLFPSARTTRPPDQRGLCFPSVVKIPLPEFADLLLVAVERSVYTIAVPLHTVENNLYVMDDMRDIR